MNRLSSSAAITLLVGSLSLPALAHDKITSVIGAGPSGIPGTAATIPSAGQLAVDAQGNTYIVGGPGFVFKLSPSGTVTLIAGDGGESYDGASGPALQVQLSPGGVAVDSANPANVFIADTGNCLVRRLDQKTGLISTIAGSFDTTGARPVPRCGYAGDGGPADAAELNAPQGLAINPLNGDLYIADAPNYTGTPEANVIRKVAGGTALGTISTVAGVSGKFCPNHAIVNGSIASSTPLCDVASVGLDTSVSPANLYITDAQWIEEVVGATGKIYRVTGNASGTIGYVAQVEVSARNGIATVQFADTTKSNIGQFTVASSGGVPQPSAITVIAGSLGSGCAPTGTQARDYCMYPTGIARTASGDYFVSDGARYEVYKVSAGTGQVAMVIGWDRQTTGASSPPYSNPLALTDTLGQPGLESPASVFADPDSTKVYVGGGGSNAVYVWDSATKRISDFAGNGYIGFAGDGQLATAPATEVSYPVGIAKDKYGNIYFADTDNQRIRVVDAVTGVISTFAGGGNVNCGDSCPALEATFAGPEAIAFNAAGDLFIADSGNCAIRKVDAKTNLVTTVAGVLTADCGDFNGYAGDGGPATKATLCQPTGVSVDGAGNIYIADYCNSVIREVSANTGIIQTVAGAGNFPGFTGDGPATQKELDWPSWVKADKNGNLFIADTGNEIIRWVTPAGQMITIAGLVTGSGFPNVYCSTGLSGDGGPALLAQLNTPISVDQDAAGNFYIADQCNNRIREISAFPGYGLSTTSLVFQPQKVGTPSATQVIVLSAIGPTKINLIDASDGFKETDNCAGTELAAGQTCEITVSFVPKLATTVSGTVRVYSNAFFSNQASGAYPAGNPDIVSLAGTGVK